MKAFDGSILTILPELPIQKTFCNTELIAILESRKGIVLVYLLLHNDVVLLALDEMSCRALDLVVNDQGQALRERLAEANSECRKGVAIDHDRVTVIGRRSGEIFELSHSVN